MFVVRKLLALLIVVLVVLSATPRTGFAHDDDDHGHEDNHGNGNGNDKVRALSATDNPDPFQPPASTTLSAVVAARFVHGLNAKDDDDRRGDRDDQQTGARFFIEGHWTLKRGSTVLRVLEQQVELVPPFDTVRLPNAHGPGSKTYARVTVATPWNGRTTSGAQVSAGVSSTGPSWPSS